MDQFSVKEATDMVMRAARESNDEEIDRLLTISPDFANLAERFSKKTPLHEVCTIGDLLIAEKLVAHKADINAKTKFSQRTPLHCAVIHNNYEVVEFLLQQDGIDIDAATNEKTTALCYAIANGILDIADLLIRAGADPNYPNIMKSTPMHFAAFKGDISIVNLLLAVGAQMDAKNIQGETPLDYAFEPLVMQALWFSTIGNHRKEDDHFFSWLKESELNVVIELLNFNS